VDHGVAVRGVVDNARVGTCLLHVRANGGESGDSVVEGLAERDDHVSDGEGNKHPPSPVFSEGRDGGDFFRSSSRSYCQFATAEVCAKADLDEDEGAMCRVKQGRVWGVGVRNLPSINEYRHIAMTGGE